MAQDSLTLQIARGEQTRERWLKVIGAQPRLRPLMSFISRAQVEGWPDPATAGAMLKELYELAGYINEIEGLAAERERVLWEGA